MARYEVDVPEGVPADVEITCTEHGTVETYPRHRSRVSFYCPECDVELTVELADTGDWRELTELC